MNLQQHIIAALVYLAAVRGAVIDHDQIVPFTQPVPTSTSQKTAVNFKPQLHITNGCHPYAAVDADGNTSGGLSPTGSSSAGCKGSGYGSQIYGRSAWYNGVWAIMYSWYFPKDSPASGFGHRHDWEHAVVWLNNPAVTSPEILAVSTSAHSGYTVYYPPSSDYLDGSSAKIDYYSVLLINHAFRMTSDTGKTQELIMWDQLTDTARMALENTDFGDANVPFKNANFETKLANAWYK
ncbi:unnamed protein product [Phytophthora fragariaefolia]|uniref:Unnamed protein product n=1 Tax=Phytophthora fragariaefolia TaxID=1490495 RepID=A0A9W7CH37_9STRA|nr:unnamed protein product [Phytophthora fragariaefolia]